MFLWLFSIGCSTDQKSEKFEAFHENGTLLASGMKLGNVPYGMWKEYYESGNLYRILNFNEGIEHGIRKTFYENQQLGEEGLFDQGKQQGLWTMYYENGNKMAQTSYEEGIETGFRQKWYIDGTIESQAYVVDGLQNGDRIFYWENGKKKAQVTFLADQKHGIENYFDQNENLTKSTCFLFGVEEWSYFTENIPNPTPPCSMDK